MFLYCLKFWIDIGKSLSHWFLRNNEQINKQTHKKQIRHLGQWPSELCHDSSLRTDSKASALLSHLCISRNDCPLIFLDWRTSLVGSKGMWRTQGSWSLSIPLCLSQRETSAFMAQLRASKILPPRPHLDLCGADRLWSSSGKVTLARSYLYCLDLWGSWLPSGTADFRFHVVAVLAGRNVTAEPQSWITAALSHSYISYIIWLAQKLFSA